MKDLIIVGAGGVGSETAWIVEQINNVDKKWNILGFIDDNEELKGTKLLGYRVLGSVDYLISSYKNKDRSEMPYLVIAITNYGIKKRIVNKLQGIFRFATIIHPEVYIHNSNYINEGSIVYPGVIMTVGIKIGRHVIISPKCGIGHNSVIEDYVSLLWNVNISGYDKIEEGVLIGSGATVIQNKSIKMGTIIGAGAVVVKDIEDKEVVAGVPARRIR